MKRKAFFDTIEKLKRENDGVLGTLIELCTPEHEKYKVALTVILSKHMDSIVVTTDSVAISCINFLKSNQCPPMTFIPLNSVVVPSMSDQKR